MWAWRPAHPNLTSATSSPASLPITGYSLHFSRSFLLPRLAKLVSFSRPVLLLLLLPGTLCPLNLTWLASSHHSGFSWDVTSSSERFPIENWNPLLLTLYHNTLIYSQSSLFADSIFANPSARWNLFVTPKSMLETLSWSFLDTCRVTKNFCHLTCTFPGELGKSCLLPSCFCSHIVSKCPFQEEIRAQTSWKCSMSVSSCWLLLICMPPQWRCSESCGSASTVSAVSPVPDRRLVSMCPINEEMNEKIGLPALRKEGQELGESTDGWPRKRWRQRASRRASVGLTQKQPFLCCLRGQGWTLVEANSSVRKANTACGPELGGAIVVPKVSAEWAAFMSQIPCLVMRLHI